jgi:HlyD family secretion protein
VHITLTGALPRGARPDLSVEGTVELERLADVVYVGRPAFGQENSTVTIFKVIPGCDVTETSCEVVRQQVRLGRGSVTTIEILEGLKPGDQVVLTDMSAWHARDRVRLN